MSWVLSPDPPLATSDLPLNERTLDILERRRLSNVKRRGWLVRRMLLAADVVGLIAAFLLVELLVGSSSGGGTVGGVGEVILFGLTLPVWIVLAKIYRLYDRDEERTDSSTADDLVGVFHLVTVGTWIVFAAGHMTNLADPELTKLAAFWALAIVAISVARAGARAFSRRHVAYVQNTVVVGGGEAGRLVVEKCLRHPEYGINLVGVVADDAQLPAGLAALGPVERLPELVRLLDIERVVIAFGGAQPEETLELIRTLNHMGVQIDLVPRFFEVVGPGFDIHSVEGLPLIGLPPFSLSRSSRLLKRALDVAVSATALVLLAPLLLAIALAIRLDSPGPVFFRQKRVGSGGGRFRMWKLRTMVADAEARKAELVRLNWHNLDDPRMFKIPDDPRVTRVGRYLRRYSLDELPQLINVLRGEMTLVGPRPLIPSEDRYVDEWARRRLDLKPGMTGLWQVLGSSAISFSEMVRLDYQYVMSWSLWTDFGLLLRTVPVVLRGANRG